MHSRWQGGLFVLLVTGSWQTTTGSWIGVALNSGFEEDKVYGWQSPQYTAIDNQVYLRGLVRKTSGDMVSGDVLFTLPSSLRPPSALAFPAIAHSAATVHRVDVRPSGEVVVDQVGGATEWCSLDGIVIVVRLSCEGVQGWLVQGLTYNLNAVSAPNRLGSVQLDSNTINNAGSTASVTQSHTFAKSVTRSFSFELSKESRTTVGLSASVSAGLTTSASVTVETPKIPLIGGGGSGTAGVEASVSASLETHTSQEYGTSYTLGESIEETEEVTAQWEQTVPGCTMVNVHFMATQGTASVPFIATMVPTDSSFTGCSFTVTGTWTGASVSSTHLQPVEAVEPPLAGPCVTVMDTSTSPPSAPSDSIQSSSGSSNTLGSNTNSSGDELPIGAIIGGAVAVVAVAAIAIAYIFKKKHQAPQAPVGVPVTITTTSTSSTEMTQSKV